MSQPNLDKSKSLSIVVVDDDALIRMSTVEMLQDLGHVVRDFGRARDALAFLLADPAFEVLIVDLALPDMNGADLVAEACRTRHNLRVVFASGHSESMVNLDPNNVRFVFLSKPYDARQLVQALAELGQQSRPTRQTGEARAK
jgi:DNA-binding NtrC family response regulator